MIRSIGTSVEKLGSYDGAQKVVFTVITANQTVWVSSDPNALRAKVLGNQPGTPITSAAQIALDVQGDVFWLGSADAIQVDILETGAI